jgi:predicted RNase H-like nuclease (RuvC/YqgF family)
MTKEAMSVVQAQRIAELEQQVQRLKETIIQLERQVERLKETISQLEKKS